MSETEREQEQEQDLIQKLLVENIEERSLEEEFAEYIQDYDMSDYGLKQMTEWLQQFLSQRNLPFLSSSLQENASSEKIQNHDNQAENIKNQSEQNKNANQNTNPRSDSPQKQNNNVQKQQNQQQQMQQQYNNAVDDSLFEAMDSIPTGQGNQLKEDDLFNSDDEIPPIQPMKNQNQQQQQQQQQQPQAFQQQNQSSQQNKIQSSNAVPSAQKQNKYPQAQTNNNNNKKQIKSFTEGSGNNREYLETSNIQNQTVQFPNAKQYGPLSGQSNQQQFASQIQKQKIQEEQNPDLSYMPEFKNQYQGVNLTQQFGDYSMIGKEDEASKFYSTEEQIKLIEQFEKQLQDREYLNASSIIECNKIELNKIGKFMKTYPDKKPRVTIQSYRVLEEGFLKQNYVLYTVSLSELGWTCYRRYSDFRMLRDIFETQYPGYFIPPLPRKTIARKFEPEYLEKRMKILEQFMEAVLESELLRNSQFLEDFLFIQDEVKYRRVSSNVKEGPIDLHQFYSLDGKINCENSTNFQTYGAAFRNYSQNLTNLYGRAKQLTKEVVKNLDDSQKNLKNLSTVFFDLSKLTNEFNQRNRIGVNSYLQRQYEENSKFLSEYSEFLEKQQKLFKSNIYLKMRYEKKVCTVFEDMSNKRNKLMASFQEAFTKLGQKKQRLFDKKDIKTWELPPTLPVDQMSLIQDQKLAFKYMLPRETQLVKLMNKKINFFNSNLFYETRKYLKIRETKTSNDFICFTTENLEHLKKFMEIHDKHLERLNKTVKESQQSLIQQIEDDRKIIDQSINGTFLTDAQCQIRKVMF